MVEMMAVWRERGQVAEWDGSEEGGMVALLGHVPVDELAHATADRSVEMSDSEMADETVAMLDISQAVELAFVKVF